MGDASWIQHRGVTICWIDFAGLQPAEVLRVIEKARGLIGSQPPDSVRTLTDLTGAHYNDEVSRALKEYTAHNRPYVRAAAVVGVQGLMKILYRAVVLFSGRNLVLFDSLDQAKDWLATT